jgi:hypothetical protein
VIHEINEYSGEECSDEDDRVEIWCCCHFYFKSNEDRTVCYKYILQICSYRALYSSVVFIPCPKSLLKMHHIQYAHHVLLIALL